MNYMWKGRTWMYYQISVLKVTPNYYLICSKVCWINSPIKLNFFRWIELEVHNFCHLSITLVRRKKQNTHDSLCELKFVNLTSICASTLFQALLNFLVYINDFLRFLLLVSTSLLSRSSARQVWRKNADYFFENSTFLCLRQGFGF